MRPGGLGTMTWGVGNISDETTKKVRNVFFLCHSAGDFRNIYAVAGNNDQIFAIAFVSDYGEVEIVI